MMVKELAPDAQLIVFGSGSDRPEERCVSRQEAEDFAQSLGLSYFEGSGRTGEQVREAFEKMADLVMSRTWADQPSAPAVPEPGLKSKCC
jgi:hypothetical protein